MASIKHFGSMVALGALVSLSTQVSAAPQACAGTVDASWITSDGMVLIKGSWRNDHTMICSIRNEWKGVSPDVCMSWAAKVDAAVTMGKSVTVYYTDIADCASLPVYTATPGPYYVMVLAA